MEDKEMKKEEGKIIRTQGENGMVIYRNADFKEKITDDEIQKKITIGDNTLEWRFALMTSKLKTFVSIIGDNYDVGLPLTAMIKELENELDEISDFIEKTIGDIVFLYDDAGKAWPGYSDEHIVGAAFRPAKREVTA
jgi:hypothetical protein